MLFHMLWFILFRVLGRETTISLVVEVLQQPIKNFHFKVFRANTRNKMDHIMWKSMKNCALKWCCKLCAFLLKVTCAFWKMWWIYFVLNAESSGKGWKQTCLVEPGDVILSLLSPFPRKRVPHPRAWTQRSGASRIYRRQHHHFIAWTQTGHQVPQPSAHHCLPSYLSQQVWPITQKQQRNQDGICAWQPT